jgi:hypothetical protein
MTRNHPKGTFQGNHPMKNIVRFAALSLVLASAFVGNTLAHAKTTNVSMKSAAPVPCCPPNTPGGCGIGNF